MVGTHIYREMYRNYSNHGLMVYSQRNERRNVEYVVVFHGIEFTPVRVILETKMKEAKISVRMDPVPEIPQELAGCAKHMGSKMNLQGIDFSTDCIPMSALESESAA